ncbi:hypothetical protein EE612_035385, partial [Oryza sativa]
HEQLEDHRLGIAKLLDDHTVHTTVTDVRGTTEYIAPEWLQRRCAHTYQGIHVKLWCPAVRERKLIFCHCQNGVSLECHFQNDHTFRVGRSAGVHGEGTELMLHGDDDDVTAFDLEKVERFRERGTCTICIEPSPAVRPADDAPGGAVVQLLESSTAGAEAFCLTHPTATWTRRH